jgi:hypothetical protein
VLKLWDLIEGATSDARRAEDLMLDSRARARLRTDPERTLLLFELRAQVNEDQIAMRAARIERRDRGVRQARRAAAV